MVQPASETPNSNPDDSWTFVTSRRRRKGTQNHASRIKMLPPFSAAGAPSSWTPVDSSADPARESKLLRRMQSSIHRLNKSRFVLRFLSRLRDPQIQGELHKLLGSCSCIQIVAYGIGSIESYEAPRLQLALALKLKEELGLRSSGPVEVFDPVLSAVECTVLVSLGCRVIAANECGRREAVAPTLFYMPHCEAVLYDNLLDANWRPEMLKRMVLLGNSFGMYDRYVKDFRGINELRGINGSLNLEVDCRRLLGVRRYVLEVEMEEMSNTRVPKGDEEEDEFYEAFHHMSWHFFNLDDDTDMNSLCK